MKIKYWLTVVAVVRGGPNPPPQPPPDPPRPLPGENPNPGSPPW